MFLVAPAIRQRFWLTGKGAFGFRLMPENGLSHRVRTGNRWTEPVMMLLRSAR
jgi:hypothetical protein